MVFITEDRREAFSRLSFFVEKDSYIRLKFVFLRFIY